tara:strand:- start:6463 stop:9492 length:3030 start_codon:yes stop_codon:yes gene_type:complete
MKHIYTKICLLFLLLSFAFVEVSGQTTIWSENFTGNNGATSEAGRWSTSGYGGAYYFRVNSQRLEIRDNNRQQAEWLTNSIDISSFVSVEVSIDVQESGGLEWQGHPDEDFVRFEYNIGAGWVQFFERYDDFPEGNNNNVNLTQSIPNATSLLLRATFKNGQGNVEYYRIDNIVVSGIDVNAPPEVTLSASGITINEPGGTAFITATLSKTFPQNVTVNLSTSGTATNGTDYSLANQIVVTAGNLSGSITLTGVNDTDVDASETVVVDISSVVNGNENGTQQVSFTIIDDDAPSTDPIDVDDSSYTTDQLVQDILVTGCLTASGVTYSGDQAQGVGYFNAGTSDFPLGSGVVISTGQVMNAEGPNTGGNASDAINETTGDADVNLLTANNGRDAQILEFDFVPAGDKLEFRYIFASEEYPEYACGAYNDVFAFIISGPGITGPYANNGKNIAIIPGTSQEVSIKNINDGWCGSSTYYVDESGGFATRFDGRTTVLTANADVQACETYHIRLIISDVADRSYNSAVFLEAESFKSNEVLIENGIGVNNDVEVMYEGCTGSYIKFERLEDFDSELTFDLNISGSATNGVDYLYVDQFGTQIGDGKLPNSVTIPAGMSEVIYYYKALSDGGIEGDEELRLSFLKSCPCSAPEYYEKVVTIVDVPEIEASPTSLVSCLGATPVATITVNLKNGLDPSVYQYSIDGGAFQDNNVFTLNDPPVGEMHTITVQDKFACTSEDFDITIPGITPIEANAGPDKTMCEGETPQLEGSGGIYYEWSCSPASGLPYLSDINAPNPTVADDIPFGAYAFTLTVKESSSASALCVDTQDMILTVNENSHFTIASNQAEYCSGETINLSSTIINSQAGDTYLWTPSADVNNPNAPNTSAVFTTLALAAKDFSLTVTKSNGCNNTENISGILIHPEPAVSLNASSNTCADVNDGQLDVDATGGTPFGSSPFYTYSWSHNIALTLSSATGLSSGSYTITVTDSKSCSAAKIFDVSQMPKPIGVFHD